MSETGPYDLVTPMPPTAASQRGFFSNIITSIAESSVFVWLKDKAWDPTIKFAEDNWPAVQTFLGSNWLALSAVAVAAVAAVSWWRSGNKTQEATIDPNPQTRAAELAAARARSISMMGDNDMATTNHAAALAQEQALTGQYVR